MAVMALEKNRDYNDYKNDYKNDYLKQLQERPDSERISEPKDEYISSEKSASRPSGLYHMEQDGNGRRKILFDDPKRLPKIKPDVPEDGKEKCTADTDKADREIEKLKEKKQQLEQQIKTAAGNEEKIKELEKQLALIERELSRKDNDTYRRQKAEFF